MQKQKGNRIVRYLLTGAFVAAAVYCATALLFPGRLTLTLSYIQYFSLFFLILALIALFFNENRLLWIGMGGSALLSFMVYQTHLTPMPDPPRKQIIPHLKNPHQENEPAPVNK